MPPSYQNTFDIQGLYDQPEKKIYRRLNNVRSLALSPQRSAESKEDEENNRPIKFSTSKASHRTWKVDRSMGSQHGRPLWKVLPISIGLSILMLWCALRSESEVDVKMEKQLYEHIPSLFSEEEEEEERAQNEST